MRRVLWKTVRLLIKKPCTSEVKSDPSLEQILKELSKRNVPSEYYEAGPFANYSGDPLVLIVKSAPKPASKTAISTNP